MITQALLFLVLQVKPDPQFQLMEIFETLDECHKVVAAMPKSTPGVDRLVCMEVVRQDKSKDAQQHSSQSEKKNERIYGKPGKDEI